MTISTDDYLAELEHRDAANLARLRAMLVEKGRGDLLVQLDAKLHDIRTGVDGARSTWAALSKTQRNVMTHLSGGGHLIRSTARGNFYFCDPTYGASCGAPTVRHLMSRELIGWEAGRKVQLTERGRFVLKHGQEQS